MKQLPNIGTNNNNPMNMQSPLTRNQRSQFDLSQPIKTTAYMDINYPFYWEEVLPSDTFKIDSVLTARTLTLKTPLFDNLYMQKDFWFVPWRIVWDNFLTFMGENPGGGPPIDKLIPIMNDDTKEYTGATQKVNEVGLSQNSIWDYLGGIEIKKPINYSTAGNFITALLPRSYNKIMSDWYTDENFNTIWLDPTNNIEPFAGTVAKGDGPDNFVLYQLAKKRKKKDYFTGGLPFITKDYVNRLGLNVPLNLSNLIVELSQSPANNETFWKQADSITTPGQAGGITINSSGITQDSMPYNIAYDPNGSLTASTSGLGFSIATLRMTEKLQQWMERNALGSRYVESNYIKFGVAIQDSRLQRAEWLGGGTERIAITPVAQTSETADTPLGELAGIGTLVHNQGGFTKSFPEHGYIMGIFSCYADLTYTQGISKKLMRRTKYDIFDPLFENLTDQEVKKRELQIHNDATDNETFCFNERYAEYKYPFTRITGLMRPQADNSLDVWNATQELPDHTIMNADFLTYNTPTRIWAVSNEPALLITGITNVTVARPMQMHSRPQLGGW